MANFFQKSCCINILRLGLNSRSLFFSKTGLNYPLSASFLLNCFESKRYLHSDKIFHNLLTPGVEQRRDCVKRNVHATRTRLGIEDFFPPGVLETQQPLPEEVKSGILVKETKRYFTSLLEVF
jgi:hypothetical protein